MTRDGATGTIALMGDEALDASTELLRASAAMDASAESAPTLTTGDGLVGFGSRVPVPAAMVLRMQRAAGNVATAGWLRSPVRRPDRTLQREPTSTDDPSTADADQQAAAGDQTAAAGDQAGAGGDQSGTPATQGGAPAAGAATYGPGEMAKSASAPGEVSVLPDGSVLLSAMEVAKSTLKAEHQAALSGLIDSAQLKDAAAAKEMVNEIDGYSDSVNQTGQNAALRAARAEAAHSFLLSNGALSQLVGAAMAAPESNYVGDNTSATGRASNRSAMVKLGPPPASLAPQPGDDGTNQSEADPSTNVSIDPAPTPAPTGPTMSADPTLALATKSTQWSIEAGISVSAAVASGILLQITNKTSGFSYPMEFVGATLGLGLKLGGAISSPGSTDFTTPEPMTVDQFSTMATIKFVELTPGVGGSIAYLGFTLLSTSPSQLDIGGLEAGLSAGGGVAVGKTTVNTSMGVPPPGASSSPSPPASP